MPNIKSVIKDVKKSRERHARNVAEKSKIKTYVKKAKAAIGTDDAKAMISVAESIVDRAAEKGIIHKNAAARRKSRMMRAANKAQQQA